MFIIANTLFIYNQNMQERIIKVGGNIEIGNSLPLTLIAGPCQIESRYHALECASFLSELTQKLGINFIYKSSFDKANRSSINGKRGIGIEAADPIFREIRDNFGCSVITDVHTVDDIEQIADAVNMIQIPALLCRQTDLLIAAGLSGKPINVKKGQFLAPWDMKNVIEKVTSTGNFDVLITERGTSFGYNKLINDMRALPIMKDSGYPVVFDATHSVQEPTSFGASSGGERKFVKALATAAIAIGVAALFLETHPNPDSAPSDGPCMVPFDELEQFLIDIMAFDRLAKRL